MTLNSESNFRLLRVELRNILSFKDATFDSLGGLALIIGGNDSGKSNLFRALLVVKKATELNQNPVKIPFFSGAQPEDAEIVLVFKASENQIMDYSRVLTRQSSNPYPEDRKIF